MTGVKAYTIHPLSVVLVNTQSTSSAESEESRVGVGRWGVEAGFSGEGQGRLVHIKKLIFHSYLSVCMSERHKASLYDTDGSNRPASGPTRLPSPLTFAAVSAGHRN